MKRLLLVLALSALVAGSKPVRAQAGGSLLVISKADHTVAIVDPATLKVKAKAPTGEDPHEVIASTDGRTAYISNYGSGAYHTLAVIDLGSAKARTPIELGALSGPHGLAFVDGKLWFTAEGAKVVGRYDPSSGRVDTVIGTGQNRTHMVWVTPDQKRVITTNVSSGTVSLIDQVPVPSGPPGPPPGAPGGAMPAPPRPPGGRGPARDHDWNQTLVRVGNGSEGFDVSPDGREVWTGNAMDGTVSVVDLASKTVVATLQANVRGVNRLKLTPDGRYALLSAGAELVVIDAHSREVVKRVPVGRGSEGLLVEPGGRRAFVACTQDNYVSVIDLATFTVTSHLEVGGQPDGMAWVSGR
jgi:YVTN family beta-propeller protein